MYIIYIYIHSSTRYALILKIIIILIANNMTTLTFRKNDAIEFY